MKNNIKTQANSISKRYQKSDVLSEEQFWGERKEDKGTEDGARKRGERY